MESSEGFIPGQIAIPQPDSEVTKDEETVLRRGDENTKRVTKRSGNCEAFDKQQIVRKLREVSEDLIGTINLDELVDGVRTSVSDGVTTAKINEILATEANMNKDIHPSYEIIARRLHVDNLHRNTNMTFSEHVNWWQNYSNNQKFGNKFVSFVNNFSDIINGMIVRENDKLIHYSGLKMLDAGYLLKKSTAEPMDCYQFLCMRIAITLFMPDLGDIQRHYLALSRKLITNATPTMMNSGRRNQQLFSCFLLGTDDSIESIMKTITDASILSKYAGGVGFHIHNIRPRGDPIVGTDGISTGIIPQLQIWERCAKCWNQGSKRPGSFAAFLEPWHKDILDFLVLRDSSLPESRKADGLNIGLWIPDLFMKRLEKREAWSLFSERSAPRLSSLYGEEFEKLYTLYESDKSVPRVTVDPTVITAAIFDAWRTGGEPYICYKDHVNHRSNQKNVGTIKSSNLCVEIMEYSDDKSYACCVLAAISLPEYVIDGIMRYDLVAENTRLLVRGLNNAIDRNMYPLKECRENSLSNRPIGIGISGMADLFCKLRVPYDSREAMMVDLECMETIYYSAVAESVELAKRDGPYPNFAGSPASQGMLQQDLWAKYCDLDYIRKVVVKGNQVSDECPDSLPYSSGRWDWDKLRTDVMRYGLKNSLLVALMPTATTASIVGNSASFEPHVFNIYSHNSKYSAGETVLNNHMVDHLMELGLWSPDMLTDIKDTGGMIQNLTSIPPEVRKIYKTAWEIPQMYLMKRAALRGMFVDQSQSLNLYLPSGVSNATLEKLMRHGWRLGLKTGSYYVRTKPAAETMKNKRSVNRKMWKNCDASEGCSTCSL